MRRLRLTRLEDRAVPAIATWDGVPDGGGVSVDTRWMTATNWVGDLAPQPGDDLVFPAGVGQLVSDNDFAGGTAFNSLAVNGGGYLIGGNSVVLTAGVTASNFDNSTIALALNGSGGLTKTNIGSLTLAAANGYTGVTTVTGGWLVIQNATALGATGPGNHTSLVGASSLVVDADGLVIAEAIGFGGGVLGEVGGIRTLPNRNATFTGPLTIPMDAQIAAQQGSVVTITSGITEVGGPRVLRLNGNVTFAMGSLTTVTGMTVVQGTLTANGIGPGGPILVESGVIQGNGSVGPVQLNQGTLAPGLRQGAPANSIGTLTTTGVTFADAGTNDIQAEFQIGTTGADELVVRGPVQLGGDLFAQFDANFLPTASMRVRLIDNDGTDAVLGTFRQLPEGAGVGTFANGVSLRITYQGGTGNDVDLFAAPAGSLRRYAVGAGAGGVPLVNVFDADGALIRSFLAYDASFRGGVNVASADFNADGLAEVVTAPGFGGGPVVRVWDGATGALALQFLAYDSAFRGGVNLSTGRVNGNGSVDIVTGAGQSGGPHVKAFDGLSGIEFLSFFAYATNFTGGVSVAVGDPTTVDIRGVVTPGTVITGAGVGGGPHVRVFNAVTGAPTGQSFFAYDPSFTGGINVAYDFGAPFGTSRTVITAPKSGGGPVVRGFSVDGALKFQFLAYDASFRGGVSVAFQSLNANGTGSIITGPGPGGGPNVRVWSPTGATLERSVIAFDPAFLGGVSVG